MTCRLLISLLLCCMPLRVQAGEARAGQTATFWPQNERAAPQSQSRKVAVIYFFTGGEGAQAHAEAVERMARQAHHDFGLDVREHRLEREEELADRVEKIAEEDIGLIIVVAPHKIEALMKLPGLYPDLRFSVVGAPAPMFFPNVQAVMFNDEEGAFMMGALAALSTKKDAVSVIGGDDAYARNLAYGYLQGAKYVNAGVKVNRQLGPQAAGDDADVSFVLDPSGGGPAAGEAQRQKREIITFETDLTTQHPGVVLTTLLKHYDLVLYSVLQRYQQQNWKPGNEVVGLGGGYIDYALNASNRQLLDRDIIDRVETLKDLVSQEAVKVQPLAQ